MNYIKLKLNYSIRGIGKKFVRNGCKDIGNNEKSYKYMRKLTTTEFINKAKLKHGDRYDYSKVIYTGSSNKIQIICSKHGEFLQVANSHLAGIGCKKCCYSGKSLSIKQFIEQSTNIHGDKYDYSQSLYISYKKPLKIICPLHGNFYQTPNNHLAGSECEACSLIERSMALCDFVNKSKNVHNNIYDYSNSHYVNSRTKIEILCKKHGIFNQIPSQHIRGSGCPHCNISKGELRISRWLTQNNMDYEPQKTFRDCVNPKTNRKLKFDFYVPSKNLLIEFDGQQHFNVWLGGIKKFKEMKINDNIKTLYCIENKIDLLRIPYTKIRSVETRLYKKIYE